jgi:hypothetical protein
MFSYSLWFFNQKKTIFNNNKTKIFDHILTIKKSNLNTGKIA